MVLGGPRACLCCRIIGRKRAACTVETIRRGEGQLRNAILNEFGLFPPASRPQGPCCSVRCTSRPARLQKTATNIAPPSPSSFQTFRPGSCRIRSTRSEFPSSNSTLEETHRCFYNMCLYCLCSYCVGFFHSRAGCHANTCNEQARRVFFRCKQQLFSIHKHHVRRQRIVSI